MCNSRCGSSGSADERRAVHQYKSRPIIDEFEPQRRAGLVLISQKTKLAEAIRYALSRWQGLTRFIDDGRIEIDQRRRTRHPPEKNTLFANSDGGGAHWAVIASLIDIYKLIGVEPHADVQDHQWSPKNQIDACCLGPYPAAHTWPENSPYEQHSVVST